MKPIEWRVRMACAERNIWSAAELQRFVEERTGVRLNVQTLQAWFRKRPVRIEVRTLTSILNALACPLNEIIGFEPPQTQQEARADASEASHYRQKEIETARESLKERIVRKRTPKPNIDEIKRVLAGHGRAEILPKDTASDTDGSPGKHPNKRRAKK